jgi:hypothetical protein
MAAFPLAEIMWMYRNMAVIFGINVAIGLNCNIAAITGCKNNTFAALQMYRLV